MKQALVRLPNERPECNDIKLGDCLRLLHTHRGRTIEIHDTTTRWVGFLFLKRPLDGQYTAQYLRFHNDIGCL